MISSTTFLEKNLLIVNIWFSLAVFAGIDAGSTPQTLKPRFLKTPKQVPSLEPISTTKLFFLILVLEIAHSQYSDICFTKLFPIPLR